MIERRPFGRTGHPSSVTHFGAAALARASQDEADRALDILLRHGVNHIDTAARYGDSELRIGPWMARHRKDFFLATKTGSRGGREARDDIHCSLERLRVDHVDLIQIHSLGHPDDWEQALGPGGALEATMGRSHTTWYQPLESQADIDRAVHWALGVPSVHLNTAGDLTLLPKVLDAAERFERRPSDADMAAMVQSERMTSLFGLPA